MASFYEHYSTDAAIEKAGVWADYGDLGKILLARAGGANKKYLKAVEAFQRKNKRRLDLGLVPSAELIEVTAKIFAETVVLGWEGVKGRDGNPLPFTTDNCRQLLMDLPELLRDLEKLASDHTAYRAQIDEAAAKN